MGRWLPGIGGMGRAVNFGVDVFRPQNHSSSQVGAIILEANSRRLRAGSITNGLNQIIASFQGLWLLPRTEGDWVRGIEEQWHGCKLSGYRKRDHALRHLVGGWRSRSRHGCTCTKLAPEPALKASLATCPNPVAAPATHGAPPEAAQSTR